MSSLSIEIANVPKSLNQAGSRGGWRAFHRPKKAWQHDIEMLLLAAALPRPLARCVVTAELRFPQRRDRDTGNFRVLLEKAAGDALVNGGWLPDDTPERYAFEHVAFAATPGPKLTVLTFTYRSAS